MKKYIKPELDIIQIKASEVLTESGDGDFDLPPVPVDLL